MKDNDAFEFKDKGLKDLIRALGESSPTAKVGILGSGKSARTKGDSWLSNAQIGIKHEFGDDTVPMRSFLRMPITLKMQKYLDESGFFGKDELRLVLSEKNLFTWVKKIAVLAEAIVSDAFDTGGFGSWKPSNMAKKKNHQTLVETQQLRNSITSEVK